VGHGNHERVAIDHHRHGGDRIVLGTESRSAATTVGAVRRGSLDRVIVDQGLTYRSGAEHGRQAIVVLVDLGDGADELHIHECRIDNSHRADRECETDYFPSFAANFIIALTTVGYLHICRLHEDAIGDTHVVE
jgi:hypothetical protein